MNHPLIDPNCPIHTIPLESRIIHDVLVEYASEDHDDEDDEDDDEKNDDDARESDSIRSVAEGTRQFWESAAGGSVAAGLARTESHAEVGVPSRRPKKALARSFDDFLGAAAKKLGVRPVRFSFARRGRGMDSVKPPPLPPPSLLAKKLQSHWKENHAAGKPGALICVHMHENDPEVPQRRRHRHITWA